jgi:hypothetical protein
MKYLTPNKSNSQQNPEASPQGEAKKAGGDYLELLARWIVALISLPVIFISHIIAQFVTPGTPGYKLVGAIGFWIQQPSLTVYVIDIKADPKESHYYACANFLRVQSFLTVNTDWSVDQLVTCTTFVEKF